MPQAVQEAQPDSASRDAPLLDEMSRTLEELRTQSKSVLRARGETIDTLERQVLGQLQLLQAALATAEEERQQAAEQLEPQRAELKQQRADFEKQQAESRAEQRRLAEFIQQHQDALDARERDLDGRQQAVDAAEAQFNEKQRELTEQLREQHELQRAELEAQRREIDERSAGLAKYAEELNARQSQLNTRVGELDQRDAERLQRDQQANEELGRLRDQIRQAEGNLAGESQTTAELRATLAARTAQERELEAAVERHRVEADKLASEVKRLAGDLESARQADGNAKQLAQQRVDELGEQLQQLTKRFEDKERLAAELQTERDRLTENVAKLQADLAEAQQAGQTLPELQELQQKFDVALEDLRALKDRNAELEQELASRPADKDRSQELQSLRQERDALADQIKSLEARAAETPTSDNQQDFDDLQRRFEMAVEDLREVKRENEQLEKKLAAQNTAARRDSGDESDWESQKQRLLASLENEFDEDDEEEQQERASIEGTIRITDEVVAEKDREITELKRLLDEQTSNIGDVAVGAGAVAELFDTDEAIRQERERLAELKTEWEGKLRQAELEISVQRAKCARERAEIEEHRRELSELQQRLSEMQDFTEEVPLSKPKRRWLSRLGLNRDRDEE